jgi:hypothetical protein
LGESVSKKEKMWEPVLVVEDALAGHVVSRTRYVTDAASHLLAAGGKRLRPLLAKDPLTGLFTLTIGVEKATELTNFLPFPMTAPQTLINADGKLEFQFAAPDGTGFFRLESR